MTGPVRGMVAHKRNVPIRRALASILALPIIQVSVLVPPNSRLFDHCNHLGTAHSLKRQVPCTNGVIRLHIIVQQYDCLQARIFRSADRFNRLSIPNCLVSRPSRAFASPSQCRTAQLVDYRPLLPLVDAETCQAAVRAAGGDKSDRPGREPPRAASLQAKHDPLACRLKSRERWRQNRRDTYRGVAVSGEDGDG